MKPFTNNELHSLVQGKPIREYLGLPDCEIMDKGRKLIATLQQRHGLEVDADFDSYGSGYASYFDLFIYKADEKSTCGASGAKTIDGLHLYLSRLLPVAAMGAGIRTKGENCCSSSFLEKNQIWEFPKGSWSRVYMSMRRILHIYGVELLQKEFLLDKLPMPLNIPTVFDSTHVFDAVFYWED